jgi:hypothetical protein
MKKKMRRNCTAFFDLLAVHLSESILATEEKLREVADHANKQ